MAGYVPVFDSVFQGTLCGRWPTLPVWLTVLPLADKNGHIDMTPEAIAALTGWPLDMLIKGLEELCKPDPRSRSSVENGARLKPLDPARDWGWEVVNHGKYREKARLMAKDSQRTASGFDAARKRDLSPTKSPPLSPGVPRSPPESPALPLSDADADKDSEKINPKRGRKPVPFPEDFTLSPEMRSRVIAKFPDVDPQAMFDQFRDHHIAHGKASASWPHSWGTWISNAERFGYPKAKGTARKWD